MKNIQAIILQDNGFIGEVARGVQNGLSYDKIAENAGHKTTMMTFVWLKAIRVLVGKIEYDSLKKKMKETVYSKAKSYVHDTSLTEEEQLHLQYIIDDWEAREGIASNSVQGTIHSTSPAPVPPFGNVTHEDNVQHVKAGSIAAPDAPQSPNPAQQYNSSHRALSPSDRIVALQSGVYVYTYSLYLDQPISPDDGRTLFKVGASTVNVQDRISSQQAKTPVPDDMKTLRVFDCSDAIKEEKRFHRILTAAGHHHDTTHGGTEWFLTRLELIDAIAESLGLFNSFTS